MIIAIKASLTDEQAIILASTKWYSSTITVLDGNTVVSEQTNPETPFDFLKRVYEQMIVEDATKGFIAHSERAIAEQKLAEENAIRESVISSIVSSVE